MSWKPDIAIVKSSPVGANQGDTVPYTITLTNNGTGPAYDMLVTDTLADPFLSLVGGSVEVFLDGVSLGAMATIVETAPDGFEVSGLTVLPGQEIEIRFEVLLDAAAPEAQSFPNTATAVFDTVMMVILTAQRVETIQLMTTACWQRCRVLKRPLSIPTTTILPAKQAMIRSSLP